MAAYEIAGKILEKLLEKAKGEASQKAETAIRKKLTDRTQKAKIEKTLGDYLSRKQKDTEDFSRENWVDFGGLCDYLIEDLPTLMIDYLKADGGRRVEITESCLLRAQKQAKANSAQSQTWVQKVTLDAFKIIYSAFRDDLSLSELIQMGEIEQVIARVEAKLSDVEAKLSELSGHEQRQQAIIALQEAECEPKSPPVNRVPRITADAEDARRFTPEARNTELIGRDEELKSLTDFLETERGFQWWAITAAGGSGKTRLLLELSDYAYNNGWTVRWLKRSEYIESVLTALCNTTQPLLLISDYAGEHAMALAQWIDFLSDHQDPKIRLLLAERDIVDIPSETASQSERFTLNSLYDRMKSFGSNPQVLRDAQYGTPELFLQLKTLEPPEMLSLMRSYASSVFKNRMLTDTEVATLYSALEEVDPGLCRPLYAMFLTDAYIQDGAPRRWDRQTVLQTVLEREERHLLNRQKEWFSLKEQDEILIDNAKALRLYATVYGGANADQIPSWKDFKGAVGYHRRNPIEYLRYLHLTTAGDKDPEDRVLILPMKPDLLGEYFVLQNIENVITMIYADGWLAEPRIIAFIDRFIQDYVTLLPSSFWTSLFSTTPHDESQALSLVERLFIVTFSIDGDYCEQAVDKMVKIHKDYPIEKIAVPLSFGYFNLSCDPKRTGKQAIDTELRLLSRKYQHCEEITRVYKHTKSNIHSTIETAKDENNDSVNRLAMEIARKKIGPIKKNDQFGISLARFDITAMMKRLDELS